MISRVQLENFQNHRELDLTLGKFTVASGPSNSGKTAVLRAIAALLRNDSVSEYVTLGQQNLSVTLTLDDGHEVKWEKGKTLNQYTLTRPDGTSSLYSKVGASIPEEVSSVLRIGPIVLEDGNKVHLNLHEQQESPFLIMDTPGQVAKVFGELTSAGKLFSAASEGNRRTREEKKLRGLRESDILETKKDLEQYAGLDTAQEELAWVASTTETVRKIAEASKTLTSLRGSLQSTESGLREAEISIARLGPVESLDLAVIQQLNGATTTLVGLLGERNSLGTQLTSLESTFPSLENAAKTNLAPLIETASTIRETEKVRNEWDVVTRQIRSLPSPETNLGDLDLALLGKLNSAIVSVLSSQREAGDLRKQLMQLDGVAEANEKVLAEVQGLLSEIDTCPTCLQPVSSEHFVGVQNG